MRSRALLLALAVLAAPAVATAQESRHEPSAADVHTARIALTEGLALRERGEQLAALGRLQTAFDLVATPITAFELGKTHMMLGHVLQAYELFHRATRMEPRPDESARAKSSRMEAARLASEIEPRIPKLRLTVKVPKDATFVVRIDDETIPTKDEVTLRAVDPGTHTVVAKAGDGPEQTVSLAIAESETKDVELTPQWIAPKPKPVEENVLYVKRTNPVTFMGFTTAGAGLILTAFSASFLSAATASLDDKCGADYCPPSTVQNERAERDTWAIATIIGVGAVGAGLVAGIYGLANPIKEKVTTGSVFRLGPTGAALRVTF
jgi:hypothetical protein